MKILLVEDDKTIANGLKYYFELNNYTVDVCNDIKSAIDYIFRNTVKIVILDVTLGDGNGFEFYRDYLKNAGLATIFLTARDSEDDIVKGLELGAEDYITKPFMNRELLARVNRIVRRIEKDNVIKVKEYEFDIDKMSCKYHDEEIVLTSLEFKIIELLLNNLNKVVTRDYIIEKIYEWTGNDVFENTLSVYIGRIRNKLNNDLIKTVKGIGYRIDE